MSVKSKINRFLRNRKKGKIFGIGFNKTGTTSLQKAMEDFHFKVAPQEPAELLIREYGQRDFWAVAEYCQPYGFFQDLQVITKTADGLEKRAVIPVRLSPMTGRIRDGG